MGRWWRGGKGSERTRRTKRLKDNCDRAARVRGRRWVIEGDADGLAWVGDVMIGRGRGRGCVRDRRDEVVVFVKFCKGRVGVEVGRVCPSFFGALRVTVSM